MFSSYWKGKANDYVPADVPPHLGNLDLEASFSYGSSDEEDNNSSDLNRSFGTVPVSVATEKGLDATSTATATATKSIASPEYMRKTSPRRTKIAVLSSSSSSPSSNMRGKSKFTPLSQREKRKRATKLMRQRQERQEAPVSPHLTLKDLVQRGDVDGKNLYRDSWRSRTNTQKSKPDADSAAEQERDQKETLDEERKREEVGFFDCIFAAISSGGVCLGGKDAQTKDDPNKSRDLALNDEASIASTEVSGGKESHASTDVSLASIEELPVVNKYEFLQNDDDLSLYTGSSSNKHIEKVTLLNCINAMQNEKWNLLLQLISVNPQVLTETSFMHRKKNLMHLLAGERGDIPSTVLVAMINLNPEAVSQVDQDGCTPLHHFAFSGGRDVFVKVLLDSWEEGATVRNVDGDLPLHVAVWSGTGNENVANMLLNAYPKALGVTNNAEGTPLHLACCESNSSASLVKSLIEKQLELDISTNKYDTNGNTPLHVAIKTKAPLSVIKAIHSELGSEPFIIADRNRVFPLQMSLSIKKSDPETVRFICSAAPKIMKQQMTNGMMPVRMGAEQNMPNDIIKQLLLADSPVNFMPLQPQLRDAVLRIHSHSWWHLAINNAKYASVIDEILSEKASIHEIVSLCQEPDVNGYSSLLESADYDVGTILMKNLTFCDKYKVAPEYKVSLVKGVLLLCALEIPEAGGWNTHTISENREVLLHCCIKGSIQYNELIDEVKARDEFEFSPLYSQKLHNVHNVNAKKVGCTGEMVCLAFERPLLTLQEIFETSRFRKRKNVQWAKKSLNLLRALARVLKYFHSIGYVHGSVEPAMIGKFQGSNNWKMLDMRRATKIGQQMRGDLRYGAPPESISMSQKNTGNTGVRKVVSFDEHFVPGGTSSNHSDDYNDISQSLEFNPEQCIAETPWDIWSFGLIMGQLVLGQSMLLLPSFEKASDAHLRNLYQYDDEAVKKIYDAAQRVSGNDAAELLAKLLQPRPEDRPQSMDEVLSYSYFTNEV